MDTNSASDQNDRYWKACGWLVLLLALAAVCLTLGKKTGAPMGGGGGMMRMEVAAPTEAKAKEILLRWAGDLGDPKVPAQKPILDRNREEGLDWTGGLWPHPQALLVDRQQGNRFSAWLFESAFALNASMGAVTPEKKDGVGWASAVLAALAWDDWFILSYVVLLGLTPFWAPLVFRDGGGLIRQVLLWKKGWPVLAAVVLAGVMDCFFENRFIQNMVLTVASAGSMADVKLGNWPLWCCLCSWTKWLLAGAAFVLWVGALRHLLALVGWCGPLEFSRYLLEGPPPRPADWAELGWDSKDSKANAEAYGAWFFSSTRSAFQFFSRYPEMLLIVLVVFALVCGWGTSAFGVPYLFIDPDDSTRTILAGLSVGGLIAELGFITCILWSDEWMTWWPEATLGADSQTKKKLAHANMVVRYLTQTIGFQMTALIVAVLVSNFSWMAGLFCACAAGAAWGWHLTFTNAARASLTRTKVPKGNDLLKRTRRLGDQSTIRPEVWNLHVHAKHLLTVVSVLLFLGFWFPAVKLGPISTSTAMLLCFGLQVVASLLAFLKFHGFLSRIVLVPATVLLVCYALFSGSDAAVFNHYYHDPALLSRYANPTRVPVQATEMNLPNDQQGIPNDEALTNWHGRLKKNEEPALVIVATQGGGIMASAWTTSVVSDLERSMPGFLRHVRLITGSSGGMVGATHLVSALAGSMGGDLTKEASLNLSDSPSTNGIFASTSADSLLESVRWMVLRDLPQIVVKPVLRTVFRVPWGDNYLGTWDRGEALQAQWEKNCEGKDWRLDRTFGELSALERVGAIPSLIVSPTSVEDGRQMLISNLDLRSMEGIDVNGDDQVESRSVITLRSLLPDVMPKLKLSTAARMTATFPFVSSAGELPTDPPLRLVDSGYNENYGVKLACLWLAQSREQLRKLVSKVILVQLRAGLTTVATRDHHAAREAPAFHRLSGLATPPTAVANAWGGTMVLANDERLYLARHFFQNEYNEDNQLKKGPQLEVVTFDCPYDASLSWHLTEEEKAMLLKGVRTNPAISAKVAKDSPLDLSDRALGCTAEDAAESLRQQVAENNEREMSRLKGLLGFK